LCLSLSQRSASHPRSTSSSPNQAKAIVIEYLKGEMKIFDAPFGVITNAPSYDWHETNLRNYINLSPVALPARKSKT
jgi:penicillin V acylase-like amidase (Ntn superfamily)